MSASTLAVALVGLEGHLVEVETHVGRGLVAFTLVGLPDASLREAKDRVRAALQSCALEVLDRHIVVNLCPAGLPKAGSGFDLAIAMSVLAATGRVHTERLHTTVLLAELSLDGTLRPIRGVLPALVAAASAGICQAVVATDNAKEARLVPGMDVTAFDHLADVVTWAGGAARRTTPSGYRPGVEQQKTVTSDEWAGQGKSSGDLADIRGQDCAIAALEVAAAGGHHLHLIGEPGSGKTMLARRLPTILPPLDDATALTATAVHSVAGTLGTKGGLIRQPPLQNPHHSVTTVALIGGGSTHMRPGAVSLAHGGVLFLDEAPEFSPHALDALRQPLEEGEVSVHRAKGHARFPADFQLVLASNPCPCGGGNRRTQCTCTSLQRRRYRARLSGPLLDRIDITIAMRAPTRADLLHCAVHTSQDSQQRVANARHRAAHRLRDTPWILNRQLPGTWMRAHLPTPRPILNMLDEAIERADLTMRGADRVLRLMWSVADLDDCAAPHEGHLATALSLRSGGPHAYL